MEFQKILGFEKLVVKNILNSSFISHGLWERCVADEISLHFKIFCLRLSEISVYPRRDDVLTRYRFLFSYRLSSEVSPYWCRPSEDLLPASFRFWFSCWRPYGISTTNVIPRFLPTKSFRYFRHPTSFYYLPSYFWKCEKISMLYTMIYFELW